MYSRKSPVLHWVSNPPNPGWNTWSYGALSAAVRLRISSRMSNNLALATKGNAMKRVTYIIPAACSVTINILLYCRQIERQQLHKRNSSRSTCRGHLGTGDGAVKWYRCCRGVTSIATDTRLVGFHMTNFGTTSRILNCGPRLHEYR